MDLPEEIPDFRESIFFGVVGGGAAFCWSENAAGCFPSPEERSCDFVGVDGGDCDANLFLDAGFEVGHWHRHVC